MSANANARERSHTAEWKKGLGVLRDEMTKGGLKLSDKAPSAMNESELRVERNTIGAGAKRVLDVWNTTGVTQEQALVYQMACDVAYAMMEDIDTQLVLNAKVRGAFADLKGAAEEGDRVRILRPSDSFAAALPPVDPGARISLGECIQAMVGIQTRPEVKNTLSEGTDSAGGFTVPAYLLGRIIDKLRARTVAIQAGALTVPLETQKTSIARLASDPTVAWRLENAAVGGADPTFEKITFTAQSLACLIKVSREVLEDSLNLETALISALVNAMALEIDRVALFGSGTPPEPLGVFNLGTGLNSVSMGTNGAQITSWDNLVDTVYELELDNNNNKPSAFIMHPRTSKTLRKLKDTTNQPLGPPPDLADIPRLVTSAVPINQVQGTSGTVCSTVLSGDFSQLLIGIRNELRIQLLVERYADNLQIGFLAHMRADVQAAHTESFVKLIGILP